ncbi:translation initiation factor IF-2-like [Lutra lutra]|uniref:translation initiation factor IF-2-like n=1 Tax=Lutra lutra TaxID=9657 RepID=UPI001FD12543|nr:translation initiation factor IF-2-like [Lutra lutra]
MLLGGGGGRHQQKLFSENHFLPRYVERDGRTAPRQVSDLQEREVVPSAAWDPTRPSAEPLRGRVLPQHRCTPLTENQNNLDGAASGSVPAGPQRCTGRLPGTRILRWHRPPHSRGPFSGTRCAQGWRDDKAPSRRHRGARAVSLGARGKDKRAVDAGGSAPPSTLHSARGRPPNGLQRPPATPPLAPATAHGRVHKPAVGRRPSSQPNPEPARAPAGRGQPVHAHPGPLAPKEPPRGSGLGAGSGRALRDRRAEPRLSRRPHMRSQAGGERAPSPRRQRVSAGQGYGCTEEAAPPLPRPGLVPPHGRLRTTLRPRGDLPARREGRAAAAPGNGKRARPRLRSVSPEAAPSGLPVSTDPGPFSRVPPRCATRPRRRATPAPERGRAWPSLQAGPGPPRPPRSELHGRSSGC